MDGRWIACWLLSVVLAATAIAADSYCPARSSLARGLAIGAVGYAALVLLVAATARDRDD